MVHVRMAGLRIALEGPSGLPGGWGALAPFLAGDTGTPDVRVTWRLVDPLPCPEWKGDAGIEDLSCGSVVFRRADFHGRMFKDKAVLDTAPTPGALVSVLRYVVSLGLLPRGGLLLHSAALVGAGGAQVLFGPSGAGKSTAAALSGSRTVLSDELCALRRGEAGWRAYGTPFSGSLGVPGAAADAPLKGLAALEQAEQAALRDCPPGEGVRRLFPQVFRPGTCPARNAAWLALAARLVEEAPCRILSFRRDPGFWDVLERAA